MKISELSSRICPWLSGNSPHSDIVISSRIRLARNVSGYGFLSTLSEERKRELLEKIKEQILSIDIGEQLHFIDLEEISPLDRELLAERHLISRQHARGIGPRGVVISESESFAVMINEEDHLRLQVISSGMQIEECWQRINLADDLIEKKIDYAFSPQYGYLTACPTNVGTGIRVSVMLHLPGLKMTGQIEKFLNAARDTDLAVRGLFGEGTEAIGDFFQLSNQVTLGITERQIVNEFTKSVVPRIIDYETQAREHLLKIRCDILDDKIQRALGVLKNARLISSHEALFLLSNLRLGVNLGRITEISINTVNELFLLTQQAHLQINTGKQLSPERRDAVRAQIIRSVLGNN